MKKINFLLFLFFIVAALYAQSPGMHLIPKQIFVGDHATLVLQLPAAAQNSADIVFSPGSDFLPSDPDIDFHRIVFEQRTIGSRLIIEFTPFVTGKLELPVIEIGGEYFSGLTVTVSSLLEGKSNLVLSGAATTLAIPGTALMLYGALAALISILLIIFFFIIKGKKLLGVITERWKLFRLFRSMHKTEKRLYKDVLKGADKRLILDRLSDELRKFLTNLTNVNCRAKTASEFYELRLLREETPEKENISVFLSNYFKRLDNFRFSGTNIVSDDLLQLLDDLKQFLATIEDLIKKEKHILSKEGKQ